MHTKKPKILMIDALIGNDYSLFLCRELINQGVDVSLIMTEDRKISIDTNFSIIKIMPSKDSKKNKIFKIISFPIYLLKIVSLIFRENYTIVHYQFFRSKSLESLFFVLLKLLPVKTFFTAHDVVLVNEKKINIRFNSIVFRFANAIIVHSEKNKKALADNYKISDKKIFVTPHGSFDFYKGIQNIGVRTEKIGLSIKSAQPVMLYFGFIKEYKGLDLLLEALKQIKDTNITLIIAGEFENITLKNKIIACIKGLPPNISIIEKFSFIPHNDIPVYFSVSDIVVLPYKRISHSGVLHLAYSFSKPVLATNVGDFDESIENGRSGILVEKDNLSGMIDAIQKISRGVYDLKRMGVYAQELNANKYSWEVSAKKLKEVYEGI